MHLRRPILAFFLLALNAPLFPALAQFHPASLLPAAAEPEVPPHSSGVKPSAAPAASPAHQPSPETAALIAEAERRFQDAKLLLQEAKHESARELFDSAVDLLLEVPEDAPDRPLIERTLERLVRQIHRYDLENLGSAASLDQPLFVSSPLDQILDLTFPVDPRLKGKTLASVRAAVSQIPLTVNDAVLSYINYFTSTRGQRMFTFGLRRSGRYRDMINRVFDEEGVPRELIHLAQAESAFFPRAMSYKAAGGMWQFLKWRGREYGLEQSTYHDDRFDPEKATRAAARHLRDLYNMLGDWQLAMAAYNCGPGCVDRAVQRTGYADFWELRNRGVLPKQTANYVPAILAMIIIGKDPAAYGIDDKDPDPPLLYDTVALTASTNLALIADAADRPIADIKDLNPAILKTVAPAGFELRVPKGLGPQVIAALGSVPEDKRMGWRLHRVSRGDTLAAIAQRYKTSANSILAANGKLGDEFFEEAGDGDGQWLLIPGAYREAAPAAKPRSSSKTTPKTRSASRKPAVKRTAKTAGR